MITEQQVIEKMRQTMSKIEQSSGTGQIEQIAAMKAYCELLLDQPQSAGSAFGHHADHSTETARSRSDVGPLHGSRSGKRRKRALAA